MQEALVSSLGWEAPLEKGAAATHSSVLAWRIPGAEEPGKAAVHSVAKSRARLKWLSTHVSSQVGLVQVPGPNTTNSDLSRFPRSPIWLVRRREGDIPWAGGKVPG